MGFTQIGNLVAVSLQLAAFPASMVMIIIRVARVLFHFKRILGIVCKLPEECVQEQILVADVFIGAHSLLFLQYQECLFLSHVRSHVRRDFPYVRFRMVTIEQSVPLSLSVNEQ